MLCVGVLVCCVGVLCWCVGVSVSSPRQRGVVFCLSVVWCGVVCFSHRCSRRGIVLLSSLLGVWWCWCRRGLWWRRGGAMTGDVIDVLVL